MIFLVAIGGAIGTAGRWWLTTLWPVPAGSIPWVTLFINVSGAFVLGFFARTFTVHTPSPATIAALTAGLCGGFTTFSAFSADTLRLIQGGSWGRASVYVVGSVLLSLAFIALGELLARAVSRG